MEEGPGKTEIRNVAVVVASITGLQSGPFAGDPARYAEAVRQCHDSMESIVRLYGGRMIPFTGEHLLAYIDLQDGEGRSPITAINATLEVRNRIDAKVASRELPEGSRFRAAITTGETVVMVAGKPAQNTIIGDPVDLAIRILDIAEPGQILVGAGIHEISHDLFAYRALEPVPLKGQRKPVAVFELSGRKKESVAPSGESSRMITSILVGRSAEIRVLEDMIKQLLNGRGGVLQIEGTAGIGKSRLISEVKALEISRNVIFLEGRALSEGRNLSFHPIIQFIKSWSGITDEDSQEVSYRKLSENIQRVCHEQAAEIIPFVATMIGYALTGEARQRVKGIEGESLEKLILKNVRDLLSRATSINPVVVVIEDAHWADLSSISFLESMFRLVRSHRLLFITIFRPGFKETGEHLKNFVKEHLAGYGNEIHLDPLDARESAELIMNLMNRSDLPEEIRNLIILRSEGNPFFIEEVIRSFIDEGLVEIKGDRFWVTEQVRYANIPETIDKVILSRIERLDEKTKSLLKTASVIGRNFYYKVLEEATQTIRELDARLEFLTEAQLLSENRHKEDVEFLFKHALAQQATYDSILESTRKDLHLKIAHSIEKVFAEKIHEFYGILAIHYGKAEVREKREEYLVKAGDEAFRSGASTEAVNFYMEAYKSMPSDPKNDAAREKYRALEIKIGFAQEAAGNNIDAIESFKRIISKYYGLNFPYGNSWPMIIGFYSLFSFIFKLYNESLFFRKPPDEQFNTFIRIVTSWSEAMTSLNPRQLFFHLAYFTNRIARYDLSRSVPGLSIFMEATSLFLWTGISLRVSKKMLDYAERAGIENHPSSLIDYRFIRKMYDFHTGHFSEDKDYEHIYQVATHIGDFWPVTIYTLYCGIVCMEMGNYVQVAELIRRLEGISEMFDNSHARAQAFRLSALAHYRFRHLDKALVIADEGIRYTGKTGHFSMLHVIWSAKSLSLTAKNEMPEAKKALAEADKLVANRKIISIYYEPYLQARAQIGLADLRSALGQHRPCRTETKAALKTAGALIRLSKKMRSTATEAYRIKALAFKMLGKKNKASRYFILSIEAGERYRSLLELSRTYFEAGKFLCEKDSGRSGLLGVSGNEYLLKARNLFEELDLQWDLREYEQYMES